MLRDALNRSSEIVIEELEGVVEGKLSLDLTASLVHSVVCAVTSLLTLVNKSSLNDFWALKDGALEALQHLGRQATRVNALAAIEEHLPDEVGRVNVIGGRSSAQVFHDLVGYEPNGKTEGFLIGKLVEQSVEVFAINHLFVVKVHPI